MIDEPISVTAYAKHRGLTPKTVRQYIAEGKIVKGIHTNPDTGHVKVWADVADAELDANVDSARYPQARENGRQAAKKKPAPKPKKSDPDDETDDDDRPGPVNLKAGGDQSFNQLKRQRAAIQLKKEAIQLRKLTGDLLDKKSVHERLFIFGKLIRDAVMAVPDRVVDDVMAARTRGEAHLKIYQALEDALRQLSSLDQIEFDDGKV